GRSCTTTDSSGWTAGSPQRCDPPDPARTCRAELELARTELARSELAEALDDGDVGLAAALAHGLEAVAAAGLLEVVEHRGHQASTGGAERVAESDGAAHRVHLRHVGVQLLLPGEHDRREGLVDLDRVDVVHREAGLLE